MNPITFFNECHFDIKWNIFKFYNVKKCQILAMVDKKTYQTINKIMYPYLIEYLNFPLEENLSTQIYLPFCQQKELAKNLGDDQIEKIRHVLKHVYRTGKMSMDEIITRYYKEDSPLLRPITKVGKEFETVLSSKYNHLCDIILPIVLHVHEKIFKTNLMMLDCSTL
jgi:hypothetical protein